MYYESITAYASRMRSRYYMNRMIIFAVVVVVLLLLLLVVRLIASIYIILILGALFGMAWHILELYVYMHIDIK